VESDGKAAAAAAAAAEEEHLLYFLVLLISESTKREKGTNIDEVRARGQTTMKCFYSVVYGC
jgi:hypothetical protein